MTDDSITLRLDGDQISARLLYQKIGVFLDVLQEVDRSVTAEIEEVIAAFNRRVSIEGRVRTNELGDVLSIHMHELRTFPPDEELPDIEDVAGTFDLSMGKSLAEHIKDLRHA